MRGHEDDGLIPLEIMAFPRPDKVIITVCGKMNPILTQRVKGRMNKQMREK